MRMRRVGMAHRLARSRWVQWWVVPTLLIAATIARAESITVLVAASAKDAMTEAADEFRAETGIEVKVSPGASNALAQQIIEGAPADLFVSASTEWMDVLENEKLVAESRPLLGNELVIVVASQVAPEIESPADLARDDVRHIALAGEKVPAGA